MPLETVKHSWTFNLAVEPGTSILSRLKERNTVMALLVSQGFTVVVEPENRVSAFRIRATHERESAISLFLLNRPNCVESVEKS